MKLYDRMVDHALWRAAQYMSRRPPDKVIGEQYLERWYVIPRNRWLNVYLHRYKGSDYARAIHDHPWWSLSWMLNGWMLEIDNDGERLIHAGDWRLRPARYAHRLRLIQDSQDPVWPVTLFLTGPRIRDWGFHCPTGWIPWRRFDEQGGCGEE